MLLNFHTNECFTITELPRSIFMYTHIYIYIYILTQLRTVAVLRPHLKLPLTTVVRG